MKPLKDLPDHVKIQLIEAYFRRIPQMKTINLQSYVKAKVLLKKLKENENAQASH